MNIKRIIDQNNKPIFYMILTIIFVLIAIKTLNFYYENAEKEKIENDVQNSSNSSDDVKEPIVGEYHTIESNSIERTMSSFVQFCNDRDLEKAYKMLTDECKSALYPTIEDFEEMYINNIYKVERICELVRWASEGNLTIYKATLYGDILATGSTENSTEEFCTFVKDDNGNYKLNVNDYIYGQDLNTVATKNNVTLKIDYVDVYEDCQKVKIQITNNSSKTICITGEYNNNNIYLENNNGIKFESLNSGFDRGKTILIEPNKTKTFDVEFNKIYSLGSTTRYFVLEDIILDYENFLNHEDKSNYSNKTSIKIDYFR